MQRDIEKFSKEPMPSFDVRMNSGGIQANMRLRSPDVRCPEMPDIRYKVVFVQSIEKQVIELNPMEGNLPVAMPCFFTFNGTGHRLTGRVSAVHSPQERCHCSARSAIRARTEAADLPAPGWPRILPATGRRHLHRRPHHHRHPRFSLYFC